MQRGAPRPHRPTTHLVCHDHLGDLVELLQRPALEEREVVLQHLRVAVALLAQVEPHGHVRVRAKDAEVRPARSQEAGSVVVW